VAKIAIRKPGMQMDNAAGDTWRILNFHTNYAGDKLL